MDSFTSLERITRTPLGKKMNNIVQLLPYFRRCALRVPFRYNSKWVGNAVAVTVLSDSTKKYLSTDLVNKAQVRKHYLTPETKLLDYIPVKKLKIADQDIIPQNGIRDNFHLTALLIVYPECCSIIMSEE